MRGKKRCTIISSIGKKNPQNHLLPMPPRNLRSSSSIKFRCGKKGISPLIATVLLIAFAVALGAMIMNWSSNLLNESSLEGMCEKAKISIVGKFCWKENTINVDVQNSGSTEIAELVLRASSKDVENEIRIKDSKLAVEARFAKEIPFSRTEGAQYAIVPLVGNPDHKIVCEKQAIKLDRLENC